MKTVILIILLTCGTLLSQDSLRYYSPKQLDSISYAINLKKYPQNKLFLYAGGLFTDIDGSVVVNNGIIDVGTKLDFADNLKLNKYVTTFRVAAQYNISRKSYLFGSYMYLKQNSDITLLDSIKFGQYTFDPNSRFSIDLSFSYFGLNYGYNIVAKPQFQTAVTSGIRLFSFHTEGVGTATINQQQVQETSDNTVLAPGLLLGINNTVYFLPNLINKSSVEFFNIKIDAITASLFEAKLGLEYYFHKNIGVGLLALLNVLKVKSDSEEKFNGEVQYNYKGLTLYVAVRL